ncbi:hypothetical protein AX16_009381 [Volvariella volvacea WC 439]|nr:hypothetical protein AX16_009381 [Volvariella volvacea WC 439]
MSTNEESQHIRIMRAQIDDEIAKLEAQIVQLRVRRNALTLISRLPADHLLRIMVEYQHMESEVPVKWRLIRWIRITHVSHDLRTLALGYPLLWTTIACPAIPANWIGPFLSRSRSALLDVTLSSYDEPDYFDAVIPLLAPEVHRVSLLVLSCYQEGVIGSRSWGPDYGIDFSRAPLKSLELRHCGALCQHWKPEFQLQSLKITGGIINMALLSRDLTELQLIHPNPETIPPMPRFYEMLSSLTNLRELDLVFVFRDTRTRPITNHTLGQISLPSLLRLKLSESAPEDCIYFLSRVAAPRLSEILVELTSHLPTSLPLLVRTLTPLQSKMDMPTCCLPRNCLALKFLTFNIGRENNNAASLCSHDRQVSSIR